MASRRQALMVLVFAFAGVASTGGADIRGKVFTLPNDGKMLIIDDTVSVDVYDEEAGFLMTVNSISRDPAAPGTPVLDEGTYKISLPSTLPDGRSLTGRRVLTLQFARLRKNSEKTREVVGFVVENSPAVVRDLEVTVPRPPSDFTPVIYCYCYTHYRSYCQTHATYGHRLTRFYCR